VRKVAFKMPRDTVYCSLCMQSFVVFVTCAF